LLHVGNTRPSRDFLDVRDVCAGYIACIARRDRLAPGAIINLASGRARQIGEVLAEMQQLAGVALEVRTDPSRVRDHDVPLACGDATLARELLGWNPTISWTRTLQDVLDDWRARVPLEPKET
jgi:GDP-4-dehydro-6-deoxy-D-mannose reductase